MTKNKIVIQIEKLKLELEKDFSNYSINWIKSRIKYLESMLRS
ncbi:MAG: hypothetical protein ACTSVV_10520 [Promethearchaeota archaeon]